MKQKYYSLKNILSRNAQYNVIIGERSNGKTYAVLKYALDKYLKTGEQLAIVRRWQDDFTGKRGQVMFDALVSNEELEKLSGGRWTNVYYYGSRWYLCCFDGDGNKVMDERPFAFGFSVTAMEHDKSTSYPDITTVVFDEFISRTAYIPDEFVLFMNVLSTIIRHRTNVKIFMLGNTVNKYCPYFKEMGLAHIKNMKQGSIDLYRYGESNLTVAVEYAAASKEGKQSDVYFAFDNPKLSMITGGDWEIDIYPHCPCKILPKDIIFSYYIEFDADLLQCDVVENESGNFTFIHPKTTPIKDPARSLIYTPEYHPGSNYKRKITLPRTPIENKVLEHYKRDKIFYSDNETGEIVRNYLIWCGK